MQPQALAAADDAEAARHVERDAGLVFGKDARLKRPDACLFGALDQRRKQRPADPLTARNGGNIDADLGHTTIDGP